MPRRESPLPFFDASAEAGIFGVGPVPQYTSGDGSRDVLAPPPPPPDVAADASGGNSLYVSAPPPPPRSPDIAVDTTTDAPGADPVSMEEDSTSLLGKRIRRRFGAYGVFTGNICGYSTSTRKYYIEYEDGDTEHLQHDRVCALLWPRAPETATKTDTQLTYEVLTNIWNYPCNGQLFPCIPVDPFTEIPCAKNIKMYMGNMQYVVVFTPAESATLVPSVHEHIATKHGDTVQKISRRTAVGVSDIVRANGHLRTLNTRSVFEQGVFVRLKPKACDPR